MGASLNDGEIINFEELTDEEREMIRELRKIPVARRQKAIECSILLYQGIFSEIKRQEQSNIVQFEK